MTKELLGIHFKNFSVLAFCFFPGMWECPSIFLGLGFTFGCGNSAWTWPDFFSCSLYQNECIIKLFQKEALFSVCCVRQLDCEGRIYWNGLFLVLGSVFDVFPIATRWHQEKALWCWESYGFTSTGFLLTRLSPEAWIV